MKPTKHLLLNGAEGVNSAAHASGIGSGRRVLRVWLVDKNAALGKLLAHLLTKQPGIRCTRQFASAEAVLTTLAEERPPDIILLDVHLGGQSGLSAIGPIKKLAPTVKVLMLTMFSNSHNEVEAFESGASGFLLKSYELEEMAKLIHEVHRDPNAPGLFPNLAILKEAGLYREKARAGGSGRSFSLVGAWQRLCRARRRQTAS